MVDGPVRALELVDALAAREETTTTSLAVSVLALSGALLLAACDKSTVDSANQTTAIPPSVANDLARLTNEMTVLEGWLKRMDERVGLIENQRSIEALAYKSGFFDPTDTRFQRVDAENGVGSFAVSISDIHQFGDGVRVKLNLGNLTSAAYEGVRLKLRYGVRPPPPDWSSPDYVAKNSAWQAELQSKEETVLKHLYAGNWNPVSVTLGNIPMANFGSLEVKIETSGILLGAGQ